jgi:hypothetical protein
MGSIVRELQRDAMDRQVRVSDLLRKALVVARKLGITEFDEWIEHELDGYPKGATYPKYRSVRGRVMYLNPYHGLQPVIFQSAKDEKSFSVRPTSDTIAGVEALLEGKKGSYMMPYSADVGMKMMNAIGSPSPPVLVFQRSQLAGLLDTVRNVVLRWALKLEDDGITGEGLSFTAPELATAAAAHYSVNNFYGSVSGIQIQQATSKSTQTLAYEGIDLAQVPALIKEIRASRAKLRLTADQAGELDAELDTLKAQASSPKPKRAVIAEGLQSIRVILENAAGNLVANGIIHRFTALFGGS